MSTISPTGTLAFITDEQALLVRVDGGWQYVTVRDTIKNIIYEFCFSSYS